jgi:Surface antigen
MSNENFHWSCKHTWSRSAKNTSWCLLGCSIGYFCRDYVEVIVRNGKKYNVYENNACRDHDGEWVWIETRSANQSDNL